MDLQHFNIPTSPYRDDDDTGSYQLAVSPEVPDDGLTVDGKPRAMRLTSPMSSSHYHHGLGHHGNQSLYPANADDPLHQHLLKSSGVKVAHSRWKKSNNLEEFKKEVSFNHHRVPLAQLLAQLQTDAVSGLTQEQAHEIWLRDGPNQLTDAPAQLK